MKITLRQRFAASCFAALVAGSALLGADQTEKAVPPGSIRPDGKVAPSDLPALAKISFQQATAAALSAAPGSVIKTELEIEDGNLVYSVEVVGSDKSITEVEVDAGTGKILATDKESVEKKDEKSEGKRERKGKDDDDDERKSDRKDKEED